MESVAQQISASGAAAMRPLLCTPVFNRAVEEASGLYEVVQYRYAAPPAVPASQVNPARPHRTDAHKCAWHTFFRRSLLQRCVPADARVDVYLWIRTATIAASMTA